MNIIFINMQSRIRVNLLCSSMPSYIYMQAIKFCCDYAARICNLPYNDYLKTGLAKLGDFIDTNKKVSNFFG